MGLRLIDLQVLARTMMQVPTGGRVLSLGYPDILATTDELRAIFNVEGDFTIRDDSEAIAKWHSRPDLTEIVESVAFFEKLGTRLDVWDIHASRGFETEVDLNHPAASSDYDLVIDCGTIEHCFNIAQAMANILSAVKLGGFVFHDSPVNMYNHGFYNLNPTFYYDWYEANGFIVTLCALTDGINHLPVNAKSSYKELPDRMSLICVARKIENKVPSWPMQSKYRTNPELKA